MKIKIILYSLCVVLLLNACSSTKEGRHMARNVKGSWILQTVTTEGIQGTMKATVFNEASYTCFIGSVWNFNKNSHLGTYVLDGNSKDCKSLVRYIRWSIYEPKNEPKEFQFKRLDNKKNPMDNGDGYRFLIAVLDNNTMQLKSVINFEGHPAAIIYNFIRK